jgi:hypothetical protein
MIYIYIALLFLENSSFSNNNSELSMLDLSSTSVSDSDTDHPITNYVSDVPTSEASKMVASSTTTFRTSTDSGVNICKKYSNLLLNFLTLFLVTCAIYSSNNIRQHYKNMSIENLKYYE